MKMQHRSVALELEPDLARRGESKGVDQLQMHTPGTHFSLVSESPWFFRQHPVPK
ncbi:hypothetical protein STEG23_034458, partial [Scotinomys teguina]